MKKLFAVLITILTLSSHHVSATTIVTDPGDDSVLLAILGFDAGSLGIVDMDFGGLFFNDAFGTDLSPSGYLFTNSSTEARQFLDDISLLLNTFNASASTAITQVFDSVNNTLATDPRFNIAHNVTATGTGHQRSRYNNSWAWNASGTSAARSAGEFSYVRMTAAATVVSEPSILIIFLSGCVLLVLKRKKIKA